MNTNQKYNVSSIDLDTTSKALVYCNAGDRDEWIELGMAIKSEFGEAGYDVFVQWSQSDDSYKLSSTNASWKSFKKTGITIGTLIDRALKNGFKFEQKEITAAQQQKLDKQYKARQEKRKQEGKIEEEKSDAWRLKLSDFLTSIIENFNMEGTSDYLMKKQVPSFGLFYPKEPMVIVADEEKDLVELHFGYNKMQAFLKTPKEEQPKFRIFKKGTIAIPLTDIDGRLWNLQFIYSSGKKSFFPGKKQGCFHIIGNIPPHGKFNVCEAEGYANAAPIHMALTCPVLVAFDSGNLKPVAEAFYQRFSDSINRFAVCADDDEHLVSKGKRNVGLEKATAAAKCVNGFVITPQINTSPDAVSEDLDQLYEQVVSFVVENQKVSISSVQRKFRIGYNRAARIVDELQENNVIAAPDTSGKREVIIKTSEKVNNNG